MEDQQVLAPLLRGQRLDRVDEIRIRACPGDRTDRQIAAADPSEPVAIDHLDSGEGQGGSADRGRINEAHRRIVVAAQQDDRALGEGGLQPADLSDQELSGPLARLGVIEEVAGEDRHLDRFADHPIDDLARRRLEITAAKVDPAAVGTVSEALVEVQVRGEPNLHLITFQLGGAQTSWCPTLRRWD